jgi:hypothetical protein
MIHRQPWRSTRRDWMVGDIHIVAHAETGDSGPEGNYSCLCRQVVIDPD